ncbi:MAG: hypothetical protein ACP5O6_04015 [Candidatus Baltobacteraceae bacterium]
MKRFALVLASCLALLGGGLMPTPASAAINYHNGYIRIVNRSSKYTLYVYGIWHMFGFRGAKIAGYKEIPPDGEYIANECCYAGGSNYEVEASYYRDQAEIPHQYPKSRVVSYGQIHMKLCSRQGIPYGKGVLYFESGDGYPDGRISISVSPSVQPRMECD